MSEIYWLLAIIYIYSITKKKVITNNISSVTECQVYLVHADRRCFQMLAFMFV